MEKLLSLILLSVVLRNLLSRPLRFPREHPGAHVSDERWPDHSPSTSMSRHIPGYWFPYMVSPLMHALYLGSLLSILKKHRHAQKWWQGHINLLRISGRVNQSPRVPHPEAWGWEGGDKRPNQRSGQAWCSSDVALCSCSKRKILSKWLNDLLIFPCN